jgi:zinc finger BED domain-containing protein 1 (E3 SUMO-protein ligase ZBED1)
MNIIPSKKSENIISSSQSKDDVNILVRENEKQIQGQLKEEYDDKWKHSSRFKRERNKDGNITGIFCKRCNTKFSILSGNSTLSRHIAICESKDGARAQSKLDEFLKKNRDDSDEKSFSQKDLEELLIKWIVSSNQPLSEVDEHNFRAFINALNPSFQIPSRNTLKKNIEIKYQEEKERIKIRLQLAPNSFSLTSDVWTSCSNDSYLSLTCQYIDSDWRMNKILLDIDKLHRPHTAKNIGARIYEILEEFDITDKTKTITTDGGKNMVNCLQEIEEIARKNSKQLSLTHIPCAAHQLNLVVNSGLSVFENNTDSSISKLRNIISKIRRSPSFKENLEKCCLQSGEKPIKLILDVPTRWNSTYDMLVRATSMQVSINMLLKEKISNKKGYEFSNKSSISDEEWGLFKSVIKILKPFYDATLKLCQDSEPTLPFRMFIYNEIKSKLIRFCDQKDWNFMKLREFINIMREKYEEICDQSLENFRSNELISLSYFFDPHLKSFIFNQSLKEEESEDVKTEICKIYSKTHYRSTKAIPICITNVENLYQEDDENSFDLMKMSFRRMKFKKESDAPEEDIKLYSNLSISEEEKVLVFWNKNQNNLGNFGKLAADFLTPPATSVESERIFSKSTEIIRKKRKRINPKCVEISCV